MPTRRWGSEKLVNTTITGVGGFEIRVAGVTSLGAGDFKL